jgi:hypothetical protein
MNFFFAERSIAVQVVQVDPFVNCLLTIEAKEAIGSWPNTLLHREVVVQGHLLHLCHQALFTIHCDHKHKNHTKDRCPKINDLPKSFNTEKHLHWIFCSIINWRAHYCAQLFKLHLMSKPLFLWWVRVTPFENHKALALPLHWLIVSIFCLHVKPKGKGIGTKLSLCLTLTQGQGHWCQIKLVLGSHLAHSYFGNVLTLGLYPTQNTGLSYGFSGPYDLHMFTLMIMFILCFSTVGKAHGFGTFPK